MDETSSDTPENLSRLVEMLEEAVRTVDELDADPIVRRLLEAFRLMPIQDREVVVGAIEREVQARRLSRATEEATGQTMHPNPNARLYLRSHETAVPRSLLERDELMLAMLSAFRVTPILIVPEIHAEWMDGTRAALEHVEPETRTVVAQLLREVLAMVEEDVSTSPGDATAHASLHALEHEPAKAR
ncbi:MAG TPA: hypothetical protein VMS22_07085 [Candidatus Eisenbacteria bacterium]|nr:hypothetical protein [Candidatus Eisenbacteria bacterium]